MRAVAALSFSAACIHASVMVGHFREYFLFGLFFAIVTPLQIAWAGTVLRLPGDRRLLALGALLNGAIVLVWLVSRTIGLPFGPERLEAEAIGAQDLLATYCELLLVALVWSMLVRWARGDAAGWAIAIAWTLAACGLVSALVGGAH